MEIKKYPVSESIARRAKEAYSFSDYVPNSATNEYNSYLEAFAGAVEELIQKHGATAEQLEAVEYYSDRYSVKLAAAIDRGNSITARCPSVMIAGGSNFPVKKKQKQNAAYDRFMEECRELFEPTGNYYFRKIKTLLTNSTIYSNDEFALEKLQNKLSDLEASHLKMKLCNAYDRKHGTMQGFEDMSDEEAAGIDKAVGTGASFERQPYPSYILTSSNAEIRRIKARIAEITKLKEEAGKPTDEKYPAVDGVEVVENGEAMRVQLIFDEIPDAETRELLKSYGFKWSPKFGAWQRQLTANGIYATKRVLNTIKERKE